MNVLRRYLALTSTPCWCHVGVADLLVMRLQATENSAPHQGTSCCVFANCGSERDGFYMCLFHYPKISAEGYFVPTLNSSMPTDHFLLKNNVNEHIRPGFLPLVLFFVDQSPWIPSLLQFHAQPLP